MKNRLILALAVLRDTWYCNYCHNGYDTYAAMMACMNSCMRSAH